MDGEFKKFSPPRITHTPGLTTKTWSKGLSEHWIQSGNAYHLALNLDYPPAFENSLSLVYEVNSSKHGDLSLGGQPIHNNFSNPSLKTSSLRILALIHSGSNWNNKDIWNLNSDTYFLNIEKGSNKPIIFNGLFRTEVRNADVPETHAAIHDFNKTVDGIQIAEIDNVRLDNKRKDHIQVLELKNSQTKSHGLNFIETRDSCKNQNTYFDSVSINNEWALVGSSNYCGTQHIAYPSFLAFHKKNGQWQFHSKIQDPKIKSTEDDFFNIDNHIQNDSLFVASVQGVYVFHLIDGQWHFKQYIEPPTKKSFSNFTVKDDWMALGFTDYSEDDKSNGEVWMYRNKGGQWLHHSVLKPEIGHGNDEFGENLSLSNNYLAVSAPDLKPENNHQAKGGIHMFQYALGRWQSKQTIRIPNTPKDNIEFRHFSNFRFELSGNNLYINDAGIKHKTQAFKDLPDLPEFADGMGGILHFKKQGGDWRFIKTIKPNHRFAQINQHMATHKGHLYFITTDTDIFDLPVKRLHHYRPRGRSTSVLLKPFQIIDANHPKKANSDH